MSKSCAKRKNANELTKRARARYPNESLEARTLVLHSCAVPHITSLLAELLRDTRKDHPGTRFTHCEWHEGKLYHGDTT